MAKTKQRSIELLFDIDVLPDARVFLTDFINRLHRTVRIEHHVLVHVYGAEGLTTDTGVDCFGAFHWPAKGDKPEALTVILAAGLAELVERQTGDSREESLLAVAHCLAHELAHYEQWRDKRKATEHGVNVRATNLMKRCGLISSFGGTEKDHHKEATS